MSSKSQVIMRKRQGRISKDDISEPQDMKHLEHIGPGFVSNHQHKFESGRIIDKENVVLPLPCPGNANDHEDSSSPTIDSVSLEDVDSLVKKVNDLHIFVADIQDKAESIKRILDTLPLPCPVPFSNSYLNNQGLKETTLKRECQIPLYSSPGAFPIERITDEAPVKDNAANIDNSVSNPTYEQTMAECHINNETRYSTERKEELIYHGKKVSPQKKPRATAKANERECLANALRYHVESIVENVIYRESELPDVLTRDGCITDDEGNIIGQFSNRKDQTRALLSLIKGRDLDVLNKFMEQISITNKDIADRIYTTFENNKQNKHRLSSCARCILTSRVDLKSVCDGLWAIDAIDDNLFNEITFDMKPIGAQNELWDRVIRSLNNLSAKHRQSAINKLKTSLSAKRYEYIYRAIEQSTINGHELLCQCVKPSARVSDPVYYFSPRSSSEMSRDSRESGELLSNTECKEVASTYGVRSPEKERNKTLKNLGSNNELDALATIAENTENTQPSDMPDGFQIKKKSSSLPTEFCDKQNVVPIPLPRTTKPRTTQLDEGDQQSSFA